ncbi:MAG: extracellular solute-binding protein, partial [Verrucomicrobiota bacterium]
MTGLACVALVSCGGGGDKEPLVMFCAAGMKKPVTEIAKQYEEEYGVEVQLQFGGSGTLLASIDAANTGDIYLAADSSYTNIGKSKGQIAETMLVGYMRAGYGVPSGNPKNLGALADIKREDVKIGIGNPDAASVGKFTKKVLSKHDIWEGFNPAVTFPTVNELANAIKLNTIDGAILWDAIANQYPEVDFVNIAEFDAEKKDVTIAVLTSSDQPTEALRFCRYLTAKDKGLTQFEADGYEVIEGDAWDEKPELLLFSGAMLRPAIEETIDKFEEREGVVITPVYNGCGILVSQMRAGEKPDAYFSCDIEFMEMVQDQFEESTVVSGNEMVILVDKGNPKKILQLQDLTTPGIKLGLSHPDKSALGFLTKNMLAYENLYQPIIDSGNLKLDSPTGDFLVNQLKAGSLDAVIVYKSNAMAISATLEDFDMIEINKPKAFAAQPYAVGKNSVHQHLLNRFLDRVFANRIRLSREGLRFIDLDHVEVLQRRRNRHRVAFVD